MVWRNFASTASRLAAAAFTNLTRDHLDYHGDMDSYRAAKERLFTALLPPQAPAILNADSPEFARLANLCRERGHGVIGYGGADGAELRILDRLPRPFGQRIIAELFGERHDDRAAAGRRFPGDERAGRARACRRDRGCAGCGAAALPRLSGVPGRMQLVGESATGAPVFVDYAHTPDALRERACRAAPACRTGGSPSSSGPAATAIAASVR